MARGQVATLRRPSAFKTHGNRSKVIGGAGGVLALSRVLSKLSRNSFQKPSNFDTDINLNSNFNATSLYSKTNRKRKHLSTAVKRKKLKAKVFKKRVIKAVRKKLAPLSTHTINRVGVDSVAYFEW